jgi:hypothetical protein
LQLIRAFLNRPEPGIVVSVDLMSTGVDIPDLECIVFLRPVESRILLMRSCQHPAPAEGGQGGLPAGSGEAGGW